MTTFVLIATNPGEAFVYAGPGCTDVILTDSARRGRGKIYAADEIHITDTALDDEALPIIMATIVDAIVPPNPTVVPLFAGIIHQAPRGDSSSTPCCDHNPYDLPLTDRLATNPALTTCGRFANQAEQLLGITLLPWQRTALDRLIASTGRTTAATPIPDPVTE